MRRITKIDRMSDGLNPFVENTPFEVVAKRRQVAIKQSSDIVECDRLDKLLDTHYLLDSQEKTTVYKYPKKDIYEVMFGLLTPRSRDLFIYMLYSIKKNEDYVLLSGAKVQEDIGMSKRTLIEAIKELKRVNIICSKSRSVYWVNPHYIFNGNRIDFYKNQSKDNIIVKGIL